MPDDGQPGDRSPDATAPRGEPHGLASTLSDVPGPDSSGGAAVPPYVGASTAPPRDAATTAAPRPTGSQPPPAVPGYELLGEVGQGGMGVVYRARDLAFGRDVAVKVLREKFAPRSEAAARFLDEARITGQLQHPAIPPVHHIGALPDGRPFLAMKLVKGDTLADLLTTEPANHGRFVPVFAQVCHAVAYAHARKVIHRDLKPANVMVGAFGEVQVMDWGLAKILTDQPERPEPTEADDGRTEVRTHRAADSGTQVGSILGTPAFMAPEQAAGEVEKIDERADVFGLGAVLCTILTGEPPYSGPSTDAVRLLAIRAETADALARLDACGADPELVGLCKRCLEREREARPRDAGEVAKAVAAHLAAAEERARQAELDRVRAESERAKAELQAAEQRKRRRVQLALAAAIALLTTAGLGFAWWHDKQATERRGEHRAARERIKHLLALATELRSEYRYVAAGDSLRQAGELAGTFAPDLTAAVEQATADLDFVRALDAIRMKRSTWIGEGGGKWRFDEGTAPPAYRAAFAARGLDVVANPAAAADRVVASAVRAGLVTALDDWAVLEPDPAVRDKVLTALRRADPDSGAAPFRDPAVWNDPTRLRELATAADPARMPPGAVVAVSEVMRRRGVDATPLLRHAVALHPRDFLLAFSLGQALLKNDDPDQIGAYRAARALRPDNLAVLGNLGVALRRKGDFDGAVAVHREAVRLDPEFAQARLDLGVALEKKGKTDEAAACYREAVRLDPEFVWAYINLGRVLSARGDFDEAVAFHREAVRLEPEFAQARLELGVALEKKGKTDEAAACYREAVRVDPLNAKTHNDLGVVLRDKGDVDGAVQWFRAAIRIDSKYAYPCRNLGLILLQKNPNSAEGLGLLRRATRLDSKYADAHFQLGIALAKVEDWAGAEAAHRSAVRLDPNNPRFHDNLGFALGKVEDWAGAEAAHREAIRLDPKFARAHHGLGTVLWRKKDLDGAVAAYREAVRLNTRYPEAHCNLGLALRKQGKLIEAVAMLRKGHELGMQRPGWKNPSARWVEECEREMKLGGLVAPPPRLVTPK